MFLIIFILIVIMFITNTRSERVTSLCGQPGMPSEGSLYQINTGRIRFHDGEEVRYICNNNFQTFAQKRRCEAGRWVGDTPKCGIPYENEVESIKVFNCSDPNKTNDEILSIKTTQSPNSFRYPNSFHASRIRTGPIGVYGSKCYSWTFKLHNTSVIPFMTLDFATQLSPKDMERHQISISRSDSTLRTLNRPLFTITPFVSGYRNCTEAKRVDHLNADQANNVTYMLSAHHFRCDSLSENDYYKELTDKSNIITVETRSDYPRDIHLAALFLADHKRDPKTGRPDCGRPEASQTGANFRESSSGVSQYEYQCNDSFIDITPNKPRDSKLGYWYSLNCSVNGLWIGQFPACIPNIQCPGIEYLNKIKDESVMIESIENVYYVNSSYWVAGQHSYVNYACVNPENIVIGKLNRLCEKDGKWTQPMPKCTSYVKPENLTHVAQSPWMVIIILTTILLFFLLLVMVFVKRYVSKIRRELTRNGLKRSRYQSSIYTDVRNNSMNNRHRNQLYDDCINIQNINERNNRLTIKNKLTPNPEYIELKDSTSEPMYTTILPPIQ